MSRALSEISQAKFKMICAVAADRGINGLSSSNAWGELLRMCLSDNPQRQQHLDLLKELFKTGVHPIFPEVSQPCEQGNAFSQWLMLLQHMVANYNTLNEADDLKFLLSWGENFIRQADKHLLSQVMDEKAGDLVESYNTVTVLLRTLFDMTLHKSLFIETRYVLTMTTDIFAKCDEAVLLRLIFEKILQGSYKGRSPFSCLGDIAWQFFTASSQEETQDVVSLIRHIVKLCDPNVLSDAICCSENIKKPYNVILILTVIFHDTVFQQPPIISESDLLALLEEIFKKCDAKILSHAISETPEVFNLKFAEKYHGCNAFYFMTRVFHNFIEKTLSKEAERVLTLMQILFEEKTFTGDRAVVSRCIAGHNVATYLVRSFHTCDQSSKNRATILALFEQMVVGCHPEELPNIFSKTTRWHGAHVTPDSNAFLELLFAIVTCNDKKLVSTMINILSYVVQQCDGQDFLKLLIMQSVSGQRSIFENILRGVLQIANKYYEWEQASSLFAIATDIVQRTDSVVLSKLMLCANEDVNNGRNAFFRFINFFHVSLNGFGIVETPKDIAARSAMFASVKSCLELIVGKCGNNSQQFIDSVPLSITQGEEKKSFEQVKSLVLSISHAAQKYHVNYPVAALMSSEFPENEDEKSALVVQKKRKKIGHYPVHAVGFMWMLLLAEKIKLKGYASVDVVLPFDVIWNIAQFVLKPNQKSLLDLATIDPETKSYRPQGAYEIWLSTLLSELDGLISTEVDKKREQLLLTDIQSVLENKPLDLAKRKWNIRGSLEQCSSIQEKIYYLLCIHYDNMFPKEESQEAPKRNVVAVTQRPTIFGNIKNFFRKNKAEAPFQKVLIAALRTFPSTTIPDKQSLAASAPPAEQKKNRPE